MKTKTDDKSYIYILTTLIITTLFSFTILTSSSTSADDSAVDDISITVPVSCNLTSTVDAAHTASINNGTYAENIGTTTFNIFCNDNNGFSVYTIGYSGEEYGNTNMLATVGGVASSSDNIATGLATSGNSSAWAMKLAKVDGTYEPTILSDTEGSFTNYHTIPSTYTKVATLSSNTDFTTGSAFTSTYRVYINNKQPAGTYQGKVKYTMVHPNDGEAPTPPAVGLLSITNMQEMTPEICAASSVGDEKQLVDSRDGKSYWVAKLLDDKCWMTQNLDLDLSNTTALTSETTDLTSYGNGGYTTANGYNQQTVNGKNVISWTPVRATIDASNVTNNSISNWSNDYNTPYSVDPGNVYWNNSPFYTSTTNLFMNNDWGSNPVKFQRNTPFTTNNEHGHVGNYYNWSAAVATNSTGSYTAGTYSNSANNPQNSICPAGWRLPTISNANNTTEGSTNEFGRLNQLYNSGATNTSENLEKAPLYLVRAGYVNSSQQGPAGYHAYYWSSTVTSSSLAYILNFRSSYVLPQNAYSRNYGFSVRCVSR